MRNIDRWFIVIGLLYALFGFAFGIWMGINERLELAPLHAHINLVGFTSAILFGLLYRSFPALAESRLAAVHFVLFNLGTMVFLIGMASVITSGGKTVLPVASGAFTVVAAMFVLLANYLMNGLGADESRLAATSAPARGR